MDHSLRRRRKARIARVYRVRKRLSGVATRPRLSVCKTNAHIYAQLIDDEKGVTLCGFGTLSKANRGTLHNRKSKEAARHIGAKIAAMAKQQNIDTVIFDRGRHKFHGIVAELANAVREAGLQF